MHVTCGADIELTCPISSKKKSDDVVSWFRPNSSQSHLSFIAIGDILFPEYATIGRFNLISSPSSLLSRLLINNVSLEDQGIYTCKSSSSGQHSSIKLFVESHLYISPSSPLLLYPVNRTFSITCSLLCNVEINLNNFNWFINGELLNNDIYDYDIEIISLNTQRLTVYLNKKHKNFIQANFTCKYDEKETTILVRRRTKEELHRLPRQHDSVAAAYLLQNVFDTGQIQYSSLYMTIFFLLILSFY
ncbi:unnamed protein product [Rotaria sp. Silwood2]|nr:unnamed protein product [Rotaria sp. Silwood2]CAF2717964.1 unnamed protein product [Rotaria sp. Silwood2]CAF2869968.1 unnamed protein product [Rotaria sp. Silwood2]CAF3939648.1 unnamed protein product [Rotaria sp. Silwood2]CAF4097290.1 unnamed protein product [Rotaria sp. Silwood2]